MSTEKKQDKLVHAQIMLYKHFFCKKHNIDPKNVRVAFLLMKRKPKKGEQPFEWFPISAGPVSVQRALDELNSDVTRMRECISTGVLGKNGEECVNKFGDTCPYFKTEHCQGAK